MEVRGWGRRAAEKRSIAPRKEPLPGEWSVVYMN